MEEQTPRIKRYVTVIGHSPDTVELRVGVWNPISHILNDDESGGTLYKILSLLKGDRTLPEIAQKAGIPLSKIEDIVSQLAQLNVIEYSPESGIDYYLNHAIPALQPRTDTIKKIKIIGSQTLGNIIYGLLEQCNYFDSIDILSTTGYEQLQNSSRAQSWEKDSLAFEQLVSQYESWKGHYIVVASNQVDPLVMQAVNRICFALDLPFFYTTIDGPFLFIGPTIVPGKSACWECLETRVTMNLRNSASYLNYKNALTNGRVHSIDYYPERIIQHLLSTHASMEILNYCLTGSSFTVNKVLSIYLPTMEIVFHEIFKVPSCKACYPSRTSRIRESYYNLSTLLNT
ncbi:MAG TPA: TOMM precursor leader peptide-binding protein [Puia sp.]|jgi:bacteriocin biosynthesis cyclodehydratase domain-containing protein|nr:TOMM precursor leader peptide-binding protein [Puia sp.]